MNQNNLNILTIFLKVFISIFMNIYMQFTWGMYDSNTNVIAQIDIKFSQ